MTGMTLASHGRLRAAYETMANRMRGMRLHTEKTIERGAALAFTAGSATAFGYVNERYGKPPASDPSSYPEYTVMGVPVDLAVGGLGTAACLLNMAGKYEHIVSSVSNGSLGAFGYRFGAEYARKHKAQQAAAPAATKTSGATAWGPRF
jgi:hypothetical protein